MTFDGILSCESVSTKAEFVIKQSETGPVLTYCKEDLLEELKAKGCNPLLVTEDIDPISLVGLDKILENGRYQVLVA